MPGKIPSSPFGLHIRLRFVGAFSIPSFFLLKGKGKNEIILTNKHSFVTGLVDSKLHGQRRTMFQRAVDVGVPASFVELRHEATHRELPALIVLRNATLRSLEWLWDFYWAKIDPHGPAPGSELPAEAVLDDDYDDDNADAVVKESVRGSLGLLSTGGGEGEGQGHGEGEAEPPRKKRKALQFQSQERSATATQLVSICKASRKGAFVLSRVLLDEGVIIPSGRR